MLRPLLRIDTSDPVVAAKLLDFLNSMKVVKPELTLVSIDPLQSEEDRQETFAAITRILSKLGGK